MSRPLEAELLGHLSVPVLADGTFVGRLLEHLQNHEIRDAYRAEVDEDQASAITHVFWQSPPAQPVGDPLRVIRIVGSLWGGTFFDDYADIATAVNAAVEDPAVRGILLDINSPGGQVAGAFELAEHLLALRETRQKPLWAIANGQASSAAYLIASSADRLFATRTALVGSVGVFFQHVDVSERNRMNGITITEFASGRLKNLFSRNRKLSADANEFAENMIEELGSELIDLVAAGRSTLTADAIRALEAAEFMAADGLENGLVDEIATVPEVLEQLTAEVTGALPAAAMPGTGANADSAPSTEDDARAEEPTPTADPQEDAMSEPNGGTPEPQGADVIPIAQANEEAETRATEARDGAVEAERARAAAITRNCELAGCPQLAGGFIAEGLTADQAGGRILEMRENGDVPEINGTHTGDGGGLKPTALADEMRQRFTAKA